MKIPENLENINSAASCIVDNALYVAGFDQNILLKFDFGNYEIKKLGVFSGFQLPISFCIGATFRYGDSLFCFSKNSYEVAEFDLNSHTMQYYYPEENVGERNIVHSFCCARDEVWIFRETLNTDIMVFSMNQKQYFHYAIYVRDNEKIVNLTPVLSENSVYISGRIWRCIPGSSKLIVIDTNTREACIIKVTEGIPFYTISCEKNELYILALDGKHIVSFHTETFETIIYETGYGKKMDRPFREAVRIGNHFLLLPACEQDILCYEIQGNGIAYVKCLNIPVEFKKIHDPEHRSMFLHLERRKNELYLLPFAGNGMLCVDLNSFEMTYYQIKLSKKDFLTLWVRNHQLVGEGELNLGDYLVALMGEWRKEMKFSGIEKNSIGSAIWRNMIS